MEWGSYPVEHVEIVSDSDRCLVRFDGFGDCVFVDAQVLL
jgi:hypothetical protein